MKVLLLYPYHKSEQKSHGLHWLCEPLALEYLSAGAGEDGHEVEILDLRLHPGDLEAALANFAPDIAGITGYSMHVPEMLRLCSIVKAHDHRCKTVVGGNHATVRPQDFFRSHVDYIVCGEGVTPFKKILLESGNGGASPDVPGVWRKAGKEFLFGGGREAYNIESLPFPDRTKNKAERRCYFRGSIGPDPIALLRTSEGCAFRCTFCSLWKILKGKYLVRSVDRVVEELGRIEERNIFLCDDEPWLNEKRMTLLAEGIRKAGVEKAYLAYCRIDTLANKRGILEKWKEIGLQSIFLGIEAVSPGELEQYNKDIEYHQIPDALKTAKDIGLKVNALFVVNPSYTKKEFERLRRFVDRHELENPLFCVLTPLPGTDAFDKTKDFTAVTEDGQPDWNYWDLQHPVTETLLPKEVFMKEFLKLKTANFRK